MKKRLITFLLFQVVTLHAFSHNFWTITSENKVEVPGKQMLTPTVYSLAKIDDQAFKLFQQLIPLETTGLTNLITLPTPDGNFMDFKIFECPMMEEGLAKKYPQIKTYTVIAVDNPLVTGKLDYTVFGFHAKIFNGDETYFIDPYTNENTGWYMLFYKHDYQKPLHQRMRCEMDDHAFPITQYEKVNLDEPVLPQNAYKQNGTQKRTYRLALACTIEYSDAVGGTNPTKASVLSAMVTTMNRVNGVFEKELSMHCNLISNNDTLIYLGPTDPYTNNNGGTMLNQNQGNVDNLIGSANYDIGHVFSTGGGGIASLASVCGSNKARGVTGSPNPVGDPFDIDYVAHEMGHQYGGEHTFNSVTGSCTGNRASSSAFEIGSGTTIMAYAGICGSDNIQSHSDDYYHARSLEQMTGTNVTGCANNVASNNSLPTLASIKQTFIIPYRTSFELTAPQGVDSDNDPLTYCWEEFDKGGNSGNAWDANASATTFAMQRSFKPSTSRVRTFPTLKQLLLNTESYLGERLPENARLFRYRCTLRDLHNGYGAYYTSDSTTVDSRTTTNLFRVTSQNTAGITWNAWDQVTVTWDVAGTTASPFNTSTVDILLSADSGKTFPYQLALNTANDGSETVNAPNVTSNYARIKVKAVGNVYFDLNDVFIKTKSAPSGTSHIPSHNNLVIYPNPVGHFAKIETQNQENIELVKLYDLSGRCILEQKGEHATSIQVNTENLSKGVYTLEVRVDQRVITGKLVK